MRNGNKSEIYNGEGNWQEAQLSQRDRETLRVIEYFDKSLKVVGNDTLE